MFGRLHPLKSLLVGYAIYVVIGWALLCLPFSHQDGGVAAIDHLFTATSAVSTTGLATVSTPTTYSFFGEIVILSMIQFGGIGYMTLGSFILLARRQDLTPRREEIARLAFVLPENYNVKSIIRNVVLFTVLIETAGAIALYMAFRGAAAGGVEIDNVLWQSIFHSISAFCTAGFSLFPDSLVRFVDNVWVNGIIATLSLCGAIGFLVLSDVYNSFVGQKKRQSLTTRIILYATVWTILIGWVGLFLMEPSFASMESTEQRLMASGFQAMTAMTTVGFNTTDFATLSPAPILLVLLLMILGASPSGTGGGLKSTSVSAALATVWSVIHGRPKVTFWGCEVPEHRLITAFASVVFYVGIFFVGGLLLLALQPHAFEDVLFETASALGTVGISRGITGELTPLSKLVVIVLMFIGRVGPITFGLAVMSGAMPLDDKDDLAI